MPIRATTAISRHAIICAANFVFTDSMRSNVRNIGKMAMPPMKSTANIISTDIQPPPSVLPIRLVFGNTIATQMTAHVAIPTAIFFNTGCIVCSESFKVLSDNATDHGDRAVESGFRTEDAEVSRASDGSAVVLLEAALRLAGGSTPVPPGYPTATGRATF